MLNTFEPQEKLLWPPGVEVLYTVYCQQRWLTAEICYNLMSYCCAACQPGFYGLNCIAECNCTNGCDPVTGKCLCPPGRTGRSCEQGKFFVFCHYIFDCWKIPIVYIYQGAFIVRWSCKYLNLLWITSYRANFLCICWPTDICNLQKLNTLHMWTYKIPEVCFRFWQLNHLKFKSHN